MRRGEGWMGKGGVDEESGGEDEGRGVARQSPPPPSLTRARRSPPSLPYHCLNCSQC